MKFDILFNFILIYNFFIKKTRYDLMNDLMSLGIHRCWKETFVNDLGILLPQTKLSE
jgi:ubiquinone/menaquinone biosynthesis C-methylase UbiE